MDPSWYLYLGIFVGPFIQEDAAVITAATLSASDPQHVPTVFFIVLIGLFLSDIWKYWIGYSAHASERARKWAKTDNVMTMKNRVERHALMTLITARFLPLARIPAYIACGYFKINYFKFCAMILFTALLYCVVIFGAIHLLGEAFGDKAELILGGLAGAIILTLVVVVSLRSWLRKRSNNDA